MGKIVARFLLLIIDAWKEGRKSSISWLVVHTLHICICCSPADVPPMSAAPVSAAVQSLGGHAVGDTDFAHARVLTPACS